MQLTNSIAFIWYDYTYSPLGFLTEAKFSSSYAALGFSCSYTYDRQGNILTSRQESQPYNTILFTMGYTYEGNQLLSIDRVLPGALPYEPLSVSDLRREESLNLLKKSRWRSGTSMMPTATLCMTAAANSL